MRQIGKLIYGIIGIMTAMIGYTIHSSIGWAIVDFIFTPLTLAKWLICKEINLTIIKQTFNFFMQ